MPEPFHFIRPLWLLALVPLALLAWRVARPGDGDNPWRRIVDARLLPLLMVGRSQAASRAALWLAAAGWIIAVVALADPTWERKSQPLYQTNASRVVVLDLSRSMEAADLAPSRLARARYKVEDVLAMSKEGQTGLIAYAGDAFTVSPLTRDANTIRALVKVLDPGIMPVDGSRADLGLLKAGELLRQAGAASGDVLLVADGIDADNVAASESAAARLRGEGYRVSVLGVGTEEGAPIANARGALLRDAAGKVVVSRMDPTVLRSVARAGGGEYRRITDGGEDLHALLSDAVSLRAQATTQSDAIANGWKEQGPLLAVLLLPLAALAFRRKWLLSLVLLAGLASPPRPAMAAAWDDLWQRSDQQAAKALDAGDYARASALATDAGGRGSAEYKRGNYQLALENFSRETGPDADYNRGNALARLGRYREAIAAYDKALAENRGDEDARVNKAAVEALLKQQQQQQQASNSQGESSRKDQKQGDGGGSSSPKNQRQDGGGGQSPHKDRKPGEGGGQAQPQAGAQTGPSPESRSDQGGASSAKGGERHEPATTGAGQPNKPGNQFAEAAKKLEERGSAAKAGESPAAQASSGANGAAQAQATANSKEHPEGAADGAQPLDSEEKLAAEQWLRRIPDDPGGLLRRKFLYQYQQRTQRSDAGRQ